jgi:hypothetical protein
MNIYRLHLRPAVSVSKAETFDYCLRHKILGVGWKIYPQQQEAEWEEYLKLASKTHPKLNVCHYIKNHIHPGDLIWTRDTFGQYYLARVLSDWKYWMSEEAIERDIDIANVVEADIRRIATDEVPGKVVACFRATRTLQQVKDFTVREYSSFLWNEVSGQNLYSPSSGGNLDIFSLLDSEEIEDLIFVYLQSKGWFVVPNSRKADTMSFEFLLINRDSKKKFWIQVKSGNTPIKCCGYSKLGFGVFLFQSNGIYEGEMDPNVEIIDKGELKRFLRESSEYLPMVFSKKLKMLDTIIQSFQQGSDPNSAQLC